MNTHKFHAGLALTIAALTVAATLSSPAAGLKTVPTQTQTFQVADNAKIIVGTDKSASLSDLKIGDRVGIAYSQTNGVSIAHRIADGVPHKPHQNTTAGKPAQTTSHHATNGLEHAHGIIQSVDTNARTVTITEKLHSSKAQT
jgi:Cu/Ag efflux protein CusF